MLKSPKTNSYCMGEEVRFTSLKFSSLKHTMKTISWKKWLPRQTIRNFQPGLSVDYDERSFPIVELIY